VTDVLAHWQAPCTTRRVIDQGGEATVSRPNPPKKLL
jgi:hypothetical protein